MSSNLSDRAMRTAYLAQQRALLAQCLAAQRGLRHLAGFDFKPEHSAQRQVSRRYLELLERDLDAAFGGVYPRELLFQFPYAEYVKIFPRLVTEFPRIILRAKQKNYKDLPSDVALETYPAYYRRNFHWQTDGYFSRRSAELYDIGVEFLFFGLADVMRRQVLPHVARFLHEREPGPARILDVGTGTGSMLRQLTRAYPEHKYYGLDLSPFYIDYARARLGNRAVTWLADNAEYMPFRDGYFDVVTSIHVLHELPRNARANVLSEITRVLRPGGLLVIEDSAQASDGGIAPFLERFSKDFHEPFYGDYLRDDLGPALEERGYDVLAIEPCFVAKVVAARRG